MISPWARVPSDQTTGMLTLSLRNLTDPSHIRIVAPPGWKLVMLNIPAACKVLAAPALQLGYFEFGGSRVDPIE